MAHLALFTPGKFILIAANLFYSAGSFVADWNETHIYNPRWPGHAKFHNAQTMTLGLFLTAASSYFVWHSTQVASVALARDNLRYAAALGSMYCLSTISAGLYPGTLWVDPEFEKGGKKTRPQLIPFLFQIAMVWSGYYLEMRRLG